MLAPAKNTTVDVAAEGASPPSRNARQRVHPTGRGMAGGGETATRHRAWAAVDAGEGGGTQGGRKLLTIPSHPPALSAWAVAGVARPRGGSRTWRRSGTPRPPPRREVGRRCASRGGGAAAAVARRPASSPPPPADANRHGQPPPPRLLALAAHRERVRPALRPGHANRTDAARAGRPAPYLAIRARARAHQRAPAS